MKRRLTLVVAVAGALAFPAAAYSHAALLRTVPQASGIVNTAPKEVALTYSEAVEPRFAIVSVTDAAAHQETTGPPRRSPANPDTLLVPLRALERRVVPRLLAGHLRRRPARPRRLHLCDRAECRSGPAVRDPVHLRNGGNTEAVDCALARLPLGHGGHRARRAIASRSAEARSPPSPRGRRASAR